MADFTANDWIVFAVATYIAVVSLVRLMIAHRGRVSRQLAAEIEHQRHLKAAEEQQKKQQATKTERAA